MRRDILDMPSGPGEEDRMTCTFLLETADGVPAEPPSIASVAPSWHPGDTIPLAPKTLRVIDVRNYRVAITPDCALATILLRIPASLVLSAL